MTNWIDHPLELEGKHIVLKPLAEEHFEELCTIGRDEKIWQYMPVRGHEPEQLMKSLIEAIQKRDEGEQYPFVILEKRNGKVIGSTRFLRLNEEHKNLEIGYTWFRPAYWGSGYNEECKLLMLRYCFEKLKTIRVQIIAAEANLRSRKAIERIGGQFEGILRNVIIRNGEKRSVAYYSILEEEWPKTELRLLELLTQRLGSY